MNQLRFTYQSIGNASAPVFEKCFPPGPDRCRSRERNHSEILSLYTTAGHYYDSILVRYKLIFPLPRDLEQQLIQVLGECTGLGQLINPNYFRSAAISPSFTQN